MRIDPSPYDGPTPPVSAIVVLERPGDLGRTTARARRAIRLRRLAACCERVAATPASIDPARAAWEAADHAEGRHAVVLDRIERRDGWVSVRVSFEHPAETACAVMLERTCGPSDPLTSVVTPRTLPVLAALARAAADALDGAVPAMTVEDWWDASHVMSTSALETSGEGPRAHGRGDRPDVVHDHCAETPLTPAELHWNRLDAHVDVPPPDCPAAMDMAMGSDGVLRLGRLWSPSVASDGPDTMTALRVTALVEEARRLGERR